MLATTELAGWTIQPGGLAWIKLTDITSAALADGCAGWSVCIYNSDLDPAARAPTTS